jgi:hypothetical protein
LSAPVRFLLAFGAWCCLACGREAAASGRPFEIGIIDFYGLSKVAAGDVRTALSFTEGDKVELLEGPLPEVFTASETRVAHLHGVSAAQVNPVCCDAGRLVVYVGVQERGAPVLKVRKAPHGGERLAPEVLRAGQQFSQAYLLAVQQGDSAEDHSQGHALAHDAATRSVQDEFIVFAKRDLPLLKSVLRSSSVAAHRAIAAQVLGYAPDKQAVVDDLVFGMSDADAEVRNNAMRSLMVFAEAAPGDRLARLQVPAEPFIGLLHSPVWSDRNKAAGALMALATSQDPELLAELRRSALQPLSEMARWKSAAHALPAFLILARIAGYADDAAAALFEKGRRDEVIEAAAGTP